VQPPSATAIAHELIDANPLAAVSAASAVLLSAQITTFSGVVVDVDVALVNVVVAVVAVDASVVLASEVAASVVVAVVVIVVVVVVVVASVVVEVAVGHAPHETGQSCCM
jgi:hypothetical protein